MNPIKRPTRYKELADPQARPRYTGIATFFRAPKRSRWPRRTSA